MRTTSIVITPARIIRQVSTTLTVVALWTLPKTATAFTFDSECVDDYDSCGDEDLNSCEEVANFNSKMTGYGYTNARAYENGGVYDSDSIESDVVSGGHDNLYTDVTGTQLEYFSLHGSCGNYPHGVGSCTSDTNCQSYVTSPPSGTATGLTWRCDRSSSTCSGWTPNSTYDRLMITCSPEDTFGSIADMTTQMYFGEYVGITFGGAGQNGDLHYAVFDTSCPFSLPFLVEMNEHMFTGLHFELGNSTSPGGDDPDSLNRAEDFAIRLHNGQIVASAWADANTVDDPGNFCNDDGLCTVSMACDTESEAIWRVDNETISSGPNHTAAPAYCEWLVVCC